MHTALRVLVVNCAVAAAATVAGLRVEAAPPAFEVPYRLGIKAPDLKIDRLSAELVEDHVRFILTYTSGRDRKVSFFDPPNGRAIMLREVANLKPGSSEARFTVPRDKLRDVAAITMGFFAVDRAETDRNFIFLTITDPSLSPIFGERRKTATTGTAAARAAGASLGRGETVSEVEPFDDLRGKDVAGIAGLAAETIIGLRYNEATRWSPREAEISRDYLQRGMNPGLGVRSLHRAGITGAGVSVGIVDQNIHLDHPEFKERLAEYRDVGCNTEKGSMHGPAVASLLVGKNIGTAPGARLYFAAAPSWTRDAKFQADALNWLLDLNATLSPAEKIRVISVSACPSGRGSPFTKNTEQWDAACARATKAGVAVLDCTEHRGIIAACYYDLDAPDDLARVTAGYPGRTTLARPDRILAPTSRRTEAEQTVAGEYSYQYSGVGGLSWGIPYAAGVLALGWQINPQLSAERMIELLKRTAYDKAGAKIINPVAFVAAVKRE